MEEVKSPCRTCTRVKNPMDCENKNCKVWRAWWTGQWDGACSKLKPLYISKSAAPQPVMVGGHPYAMPHQVREYLQKDPCESCPCPKELYTSPCPSRRTWEEIKNEVSG